MNKTKIILLVIGIAAVSAIAMQELSVAQEEIPMTDLGQTPMENVERLIAGAQTTVSEEIASGQVVPPYREPQLQILRGVAFDKFSGKSQDVVILRLHSNGYPYTYFLIGGDVYTMKFVNSFKYNNFWLAKFSTNTGSEILLTVHKMGRTAYISGTFRNSMLHFEPYYMPYVQPPCRYIENPLVDQPIKICDEVRVAQGAQEFWE